MEKKQKIVVIVGPTASGKTSLSVELAKKFRGEIVSADSRQVYRGLNLGTGKVTEEETGGVPHHLIDVADPKSTYTVTDFVRDGRAAIEDILSRSMLPIVVGGTFFYIDALLGRVSTPNVPPNNSLRGELEARSIESLYAELCEKDPERGKTIDAKNKRRLIRALEIVEAVGVVPAIIPESLYDAFIIGVDIEKDALHKNIHDRLIARIDAGMIEEVAGLHAHGLSYERMEDLGLEYRYIARFLRGVMTKGDMLRELEMKIRQYAKRQMTWLKSDSKIVWVRKNEMADIENRIVEFLDKK